MLILLACQGSAGLPAASTAMPEGGLTGGSSNTIHLADSPAKIALPPGNRPDTAPAAGTVPLNRGWRRAASSAFEVASPERLRKKRQYREAPSGVSLVRGDKVLRFGQDWSIHEGKLRIQSEQDPSEDQVYYVSMELREEEARLESKLTDGSPQDFVRYSHTAPKGDAQLTRSGLLLPAPASFELTLTVPEQARFTTSLTMVSASKAMLSQGASLRVLINGELVERWPVSSSGGYQDKLMDLSRWAGQTVTLRLETDPEGSPDWDYVFLAEPLITGAPLGPVRRVVVIGVDTLRYDALSQSGYPTDTSPALDSMAQSSLIFEHAWAPAPRTRPSFRSSTTGRYPLAAIDAQSFGQTLSEQGFVTGGVTANVHLVPRFGFSDGYDSWLFENSVDANVQLARATEFVEANQDRDSLLFLHLMDPHSFYNAPGRYKNMYTSAEQGPMEAMYNRWQILSMASTFSDENKRWLRQRYDGEVRYMADQLGAWLAWLLRQPGETLIVLHSDHGEEFWDHGGYEHNHTLYEEVVRANLWIRPPEGWSGGPHRVSEAVSLVDIAPTLYDMLGIPEEAWPKVDGVSLRPFMDAQSTELEALKRELSERPLQVGHLMYDQELWATVYKGHKYILRTWDGHEELYDLNADPTEQNNLASQAELAPYYAAMQASAGFDTGPGLRLRIDSADRPFVLIFDAPVQAAVMDPEAQRDHRANVEWGDMPSAWPDDVGILNMAPDHKSFSFEPGSLARGTVLITLPAGTTGRLIVDGQDKELAIGAPTKIQGVRLRAEPGAVMVIDDHVFEHVPITSSRDAAMEEALEVLGYIDKQ